MPRSKRIVLVENELFGHKLDGSKAKNVSEPMKIEKQLYFETKVYEHTARS